MASVVSICNLALSHLGDRATLSSIDPPEGSAQGDHCAQFWPIARDEALAAYDWRFASHVTSTAQLDDSIQTNPSWLYAYQLPADFIAAREVVYEEGSLFLEPGIPDFEGGTIDDGSMVLFTQLTDLSIRYTRRVVDPNRYTSGFVTAVSYLLASYLAGPVVKGKTAVQMAAAMRQAWDRLASKASVTDANQSQGRRTFKPAGLKARGYSGGQTIVEQGAYRHALPFWAED